MKNVIFYGLIILLAGTGCRQVFGKRINGNGHITTQERSTGSFNSIDVSGAIDVIARQDSATNVKIEADDNLVGYVEIDHEGNTLHIHTRQGYNLRPSKHIRVYVSSPEYKNFEASGACNLSSASKIASPTALRIDLSGSSDVDMQVDAPKIEAEMSGAGSVKLKGNTKDITIKGSGSSDIKCFDLLAENVTVDISGAGDAEVFASTKLNVEVSGAGTVKYKGNPSVTQNISGAGSVKKAE